VVNSRPAAGNGVRLGTLTRVIRVCEAAGQDRENGKSCSNATFGEQTGETEV
jgi:hypothetical protein